MHNAQLLAAAILISLKADSDGVTLVPSSMKIRQSVPNIFFFFLLLLLPPLLLLSSSSIFWLVGSFPSRFVASYSFHCCITVRSYVPGDLLFNPLNPELNPICYLLALLGAHHLLHVSRIRVKLLTFRLLMSHIYEAPILDVSRSHTTTQHSR